jgi:hypothetical protein
VSRPEVIEAIPRQPSGKCDFILSAGKEGKERVRVVLSMRGTFVCMTCVRADDCVHATIARDYFAEHHAEIDGRGAAA